MMDRIRAANPVPDALAAPAIEEVWRRVESAEGYEPSVRVRRRSWRPALPSMGGVVAVVSLGAVLAVGFAGVVLLGHHRASPSPRRVITTGVGTSRGRSHASSVRRVRSLLAGIPQSGTVLGDPHAAVTLTVFADLQCSICGTFFAGPDFRHLVAREIRRGRVKVDYRSLCTATCSVSRPARFETQQVAAYAAGPQRRFWQYALLFYLEQGREGTRYVTPAYLNRLARQVPGLRIGRWRGARHDPALRAQVRRDQTVAARARVDSTPTLIIKGPRGTRRVVGLTPYSQIQGAIRQTE